MLRLGKAPILLSTVLLLTACGATARANREASQLPDRRLFVMFTRDDPALHDLLLTSLGRRDYVSLDLGKILGESRRRIPRSHRYVIPPHAGVFFRNAQGVAAWTRQGCATSTPGMIMYDPEHWVATPSREQDDIEAAIDAAATLVRSTGCHRFAIAPDAVFMFGMHPERCSYDLEEGVYRHIDWSRVDAVDIQAQRLLSDGCHHDLGMDDYRKVVSTIAAFARVDNPDIRVVSQMSFRHTPPGRIRSAITQVDAVVDGIYLAYPSGNLKAPCDYCSPGNLRSVLDFLRPGLSSKPGVP